jgi:hypothetical protein
MRLQQLERAGAGTIGLGLAVASMFFLGGCLAEGTASEAAEPAGAAAVAADPPPEAAPAPAKPDSVAPATTPVDTAQPQVSEAAPVSASRVRYPTGEDPDFAARMGWPVQGPDLLPGSILPARRIIAYYGNPLSKRMGVLGEYESEEMLRMLDAEVAAWNEADPSTPAIPALHLIAVVAQAAPGPSGKYRTRMRDSLVERVAEWADTRDALVFLDVQVGTGTVQEEVPRLASFLARSNFHLGIDPEFAMHDGIAPGRKIGTLDAADINFAIDLLAKIVDDNNLPPKVLVIHRFTRNMITNASAIKLDPRVQVVINMDGWGASWLKRDTYRDYIVREPVQFTGFKLFYHNDTKKGDPLMLPADLLRLKPIPLYIQYQ